MIFYKINIIIDKQQYLFIKKYLILFAFLFFYCVLSAQNVSKKDSINASEIISLDNLMHQDSVPSDSIQNDSIINAGILSKDAIDREIEYSCKDSMMFSMTNKEIYLYGNAEIKTEEINLNSEFIKIDTKDYSLFASGRKDSTGRIIGKPEFSDDGEKFNATSLMYNLKTKKGIVKEVITKYDDGFLHGERTKMHPNKEIHISSGKYTTCDLEHPHFYIELTKAKVLASKKVVSGPMYFVIADIPLKFIGLPFGYIPNQQKNASGILIPQYGEEERRGFFLRGIGYFFAINDYLNTTLTFDAYTQGSWGTNVRSNFKKRYKYSGNIDIKYNINKYGEKILPSYSEDRTFWVAGSYTQDPKANPNSNFSVSLNFGSSEHNQNNAVNIDEYTNNTKSSSISYRRSRPGSIFNLSANANATQNTSTKMVNLSLPTISLNMKRLFPFKQKISSGKAKWYEKISVGFNSSLRNTVNIRDSLLFTEEALYKMRNGFKYSIPVGTSFKILEYVNVSPSINYNGRAYLNYIEKRTIQMPNAQDSLVEDVLVDTLQGMRYPFDFSFSFPLSTKLFGTFNFKKGKIKAIRHVLSPSISFNYRPDFSTDFWGYYDYYNPEEPSSLYSYYDTGIYGKPPSGRSGSIGLSLGNNIEMKVKNKNDTAQDTKKIKIFESIGINSSYNLAADSLNWSNFSVRGNTKLLKKITVNIGAIFDPYIRDSTNKKINTYEWNKNRRLARLDNASLSISGSFDSKSFGGDDEKEKTPTNYCYANPEIPYADFSVPWGVKIGYNLNIKNNFDTQTQKYVKDLTQTISISGNINLTNNWLFSARADYDFKTQKIAHSSLTIHRNLHCWEMGLTVIPFGIMKSYNFRINIKSSIFQGIEYKKAKFWRDNL